MSRFVGRIFGGSSTALIASLFETHPPSAQELRHLEEMLDDLRKRPKLRPIAAEPAPLHPTPPLPASGEGAGEPSPRLRGDRGGARDGFRTQPRAHKHSKTPGESRARKART